MFLSSYAFHFSVKALGQITTCFSVVLGALTSISPQTAEKGPSPLYNLSSSTFLTEFQHSPFYFFSWKIFSLFIGTRFFFFFVLLLKFNLPWLKNQKDCVCEVSIWNSLFPRGTRILIQIGFSFPSLLWVVTVLICI